MGTLPIINPQRVVGLLLVLCVVLNSLLSRSWYARGVERLKLAKGPVLLVSSFFLWRLLSAFFSEDPVYSLFIVTIDIMLQFVFFILIIVEFNSRRDVRAGLNIILAGAILVVLFGVIESITEHNIFFSLAPSGSSDTAYIASAVSEKIRESYRVQAAFLHPLVLAEYLVIVIPVAVMFLFFLQCRLLFKISAAFVLAGGLYVLICTGSRSGIVAFGIQIIVFSFFLLRQKIKKSRGFRTVFVFTVAVGVFCAVSVVAYYYGPNLLLGRDSTEMSSTATRLIQLYKGSSAVEDKPLMGWGPGVGGNYAAVENPKTGMATVDDYYLSLALESGIPALVLFVLMLWMFIQKSRQIAKLSTINYSRTAEFFSISLIGFAIFCTILSIYEIFTIIFVIFGLIIVMQRDITSDKIICSNQI